MTFLEGCIMSQFKTGVLKSENVTVYAYLITVTHKKSFISIKPET